MKDNKNENQLAIVDRCESPSNTTNKSYIDVDVTQQDE